MKWNSETKVKFFDVNMDNNEKKNSSEYWMAALKDKSKVEKNAALFFYEAAHQKFINIKKKLNQKSTFYHFT